MSPSVDLIGLECVRCGTPVPAEPEEVAWICANCGQGLRLDDEAGLAALGVHFGAGSRKDGLRWRPFWVASGRVQVSSRESYGRDAAPDPLWAGPVRFVIPAFATSLEQAVAWGTDFVRRPPDLTAGEPTDLESVTVDPAAVHPLARFVVLSVEASRRDMLEQIAFVIDLAPPELWCLPVAA